MATGSAVPAMNIRVQHASTASGAVVPEIIDGAAEESGLGDSDRTSLFVRAHCGC